MRVFVTGANGFIGGHLVSHLLSLGADITTLVRPEDRTPGLLQARELELEAPWSRDGLAGVLASGRPNVIFHLVGAVRAETLSALYEANVFLSQRLLDAAKVVDSKPVVVLLGSAAEYGYPVVPGKPSDEEDRCLPVTDYGIVKHSQTLHALARSRHGQPIVVARLFNPVGPGLPPGFALSDFAKQIRDGVDVLRVGNLRVSRDFLSAADAVRVICDLSLCENARGRVVNICSGVPQELRLLLDRLIARSGRRIRIEIDPNRFREADVPVSYGNTDALLKLGIRPPAPLNEDTLGALLSE